MKALFLGFLLILSGCSNDNLPSYVALGTLRVLGIVACSPEVNAGGSTKLHAIISDLSKGSSRVLTEKWETCEDPGVARGAEPTCDGAADRVLQYSGSVSSLSSPYFTGRSTNITVTVPSTILNNRTDMDKYNGVAYLAVYTLTASNGESVKSFKRIMVTDSSKTQKNANPVFQAVKKDSAALSALPSTAASLWASFAGGSQEIFALKLESGALFPQQEELQTTWFTSEGEFKFYRTIGNDVNPWSPPGSQPSGRSVVLVTVARDGRGGEDAISFPTSLLGSPSLAQAHCP